jgi:hypothetical protein
MRAIFCAGAAIVAALVASPAFAADINTPFAAVEVAPARVELAVPDSQPVHRTLVVANLSTSAETVHIEQADFTVAGGTYQFLQPLSTPWSIAPGLGLSTADLHLQPKSQAKLVITYTPITQTALRAGALIFTPTVDGATAAPTGTGVVIKQKVVVPVLAVPAGSDGTLDTNITLTAESAGMNLPSAWGWPQLSFQESGPITATATFRNSGNAIGRFDTWFAWSNLGREFLQTESPPGIALPGTTSTATGSTKLMLPGQATMADTAPLFGIIQVHASSSLILLSQRSPEASQDRYVVIAPWRALGLALAIAGGIWWGARRVRPRRTLRP